MNHVDFSGSDAILDYMNKDRNNHLHEHLHYCSKQIKFIFECQ